MDFTLSFLTADFPSHPVWVWLAFVGIVTALLAFDLGVLHKDDHEIGVRESLLLSAGYIRSARSTECVPCIRAKCCARGIRRH